MGVALLIALGFLVWREKTRPRGVGNGVPSEIGGRGIYAGVEQKGPFEVHSQGLQEMGAEDRRR
jgi:hypothetical protein